MARNEHGTTLAAERGVLAQLAEIQRMSLGELRVRWRELFGRDPPGYSREMMARRLAYRVQELAYGGVPEATRQKLRDHLGGGHSGEPGAPVRPLVRRGKPEGVLAPGTRLVREWHGERHEVLVLDGGGFEYRGRPYRSLSRIAQEITGVKWNGKLYFGLKSRGRVR